MSEELKGCPFCGAEGSRLILEIQEPHSHLIATFMPDHTGSATIECGGCNIGMVEDNAEKVIAAWNRRAAKPAVPGWKLVPMEPTSDMQAAGAQAIRFDTTVINKLWTGNAVFRAMIAAAPEKEPTS